MKTGSSSKLELRKLAEEVMQGLKIFQHQTVKITKYMQQTDSEIASSFRRSKKKVFPWVLFWVDQKKQYQLGNKPTRQLFANTYISFIT